MYVRGMEPIRLSFLPARKSIYTVIRKSGNTPLMPGMRWMTIIIPPPAICGRRLLESRRIGRMIHSMIYSFYRADMARCKILRITKRIGIITSPPSPLLKRKIIMRRSASAPVRTMPIWCGKRPIKPFNAAAWAMGMAQMASGIYAGRRMIVLVANNGVLISGLKRSIFRPDSICSISMNFIPASNGGSFIHGSKMKTGQRLTTRKKRY